MKVKLLYIPLFLFSVEILIGAIYLINLHFNLSNTLGIMVNLDGEANLPAWFSSAQLFVISVLFGIYSFFNFNMKDKKSWILIMLPLLFLFLSIDETAQIHETIGHLSDRLLPDQNRKSTIFKNSGIWVFLIGIPFILFTVYLFSSLKSYLSSLRVIYKKLILGFSLWISGALFFELLNNFFEEYSYAYYIQVFFEEILEMAGATIILWAALDLLVKNNFKLHLDGIEKK